jgi:hypothetical protein
MGCLALLIKSRDLISAFKRPCKEAVELYTRASAHMALLYCHEGRSDLANDIIEGAIQLSQSVDKNLLPSCLARGQIQAAKFSVNHTLCHDGIECVEDGKEALRLLEGDEQNEPITQDWVAATKIRLARCYLTSNELDTARTLTHDTIEHYERQSEIESSQVHLARAFRQQACIYEAQRNMAMSRAMQAAAKELLVEVRQSDLFAQRHLPDLGDFSLQVYEQHIMEFWLR